MHGAQPMPSARPSSGAPMSPRLPRTCGMERALREAEDADEDEAEQDDDDAEDAGDDVGVLDEELPERAAEDVHRHEDDGEPGDEQQHPPRRRARPGVSSSALGRRLAPAIAVRGAPTAATDDRRPDAVPPRRR